MRMGWNSRQISDAIDTSGSAHCLASLSQRGISIRWDGEVVTASDNCRKMTPESILWSQARKLFSPIMQSIQKQELLKLQQRHYGDLRELARLRSCLGDTSGRWLDAYLSSWWPIM